MNDVVDKVAFITGGSSGIGLGIARAFVDAGMKVAITYQTQSDLEEATQCLKDASDRVYAIRGDVTDRHSLERAVEETAKVFGRVHVLASNAGIQLPSTLAATSYEDWDRLIGTNLTGVFNSIRAFLPHVCKNGEGGHIITTASVAGLCVMGSGFGAYLTSKFAIVGFTEALRAELIDSNIGVSVFCPGMVQSNLDASLKNHPAASDPFEIGRLVLRGMQNNDLYILTHPEFEPLIKLRHEALLASIPKDVRPRPASTEMVRSFLRTSVYSGERELVIGSGTLST